MEVHLVMPLATLLEASSMSVGVSAGMAGTMPRPCIIVTASVGLVVR